MNANPQRNSNMILCYSLISLGVLCILLTLVSALALKNGIIEKFRKPLPIESLKSIPEINSVNRQIQDRERQIQIEKSMPDREKSFREAREKLNKISGKKNAVNSNLPDFEQDKANKIKKLEDEKAQLTAKKEELTENMRANNARQRSWGEWFEDFNIGLILKAILPLGIFGFFLARLTFWGRLPAANPFSLTGFEKRCVLFLPFAIVISAFGFFLFVWFLTILY